MTTIHAAQALLPEGWAGDVTVRLRDGRIAEVGTGTTGETRVHTLLPAPANLHGHAFQRAMAGLTERRGDDPSDSFWTWRRLMFRFLDRLTPDDVQAIAAFVQMEMLEAGFGAAVEFHYLHHAPGGRPYDDLAEMSARIAAAAATSGIALTLLPVLYQWGGLDRRALAPGQDRFGNDPDRFARLWAGAREALRGLPDARIGVAPHSLRAVDRAGLDACMALGGPIHMHLAEQVAEVEEVQAATGARPVAWALANLPLGPDWCLIHATQMTPDETTRLAATGAVAGLCPVTESSLGDGIFDGRRWMGAGGAWGIGSDSHIRIGLTEELRTLDYSQRLRDRVRAPFAEAGRSSGRMLWEGACAGGAQAAGRGTGIAAGQPADLVGCDDLGPDGIGRQGDAWLDTLVFAAGDRAVREVWSGGRHLVRDGRHVAREAITAAYARTMAGLADAL